MKLAILLSLFVTLSVQAASEKTLLACSTPGDAIGAVDVVIKADKSAVIRTTGMDDSPPVEYKIISGLDDLKKKDSTTIIAQGEDSYAYGGALTDAVLLRVFAGQKSARFAAGGTVYYLQCNL